jgi:hypothetical protein
MGPGIVCFFRSRGNYPQHSGKAVPYRSVSVVSVHVCLITQVRHNCAKLLHISAFGPCDFGESDYFPYALLLWIGFFSVSTGFACSAVECQTLS